MYSSADPQRNCTHNEIHSPLLHHFKTLKVKMHFFNSASLGSQDNQSRNVHPDLNFPAVTEAISDPHTVSGQWYWQLILPQCLALLQCPSGTAAPWGDSVGVHIKCVLVGQGLQCSLQLIAVPCCCPT